MSRTIAAIHSSPPATIWSMPAKMVFEQLVNHESGSRTERITNASGLAAESSGQKLAPGQSTCAV